MVDLADGATLDVVEPAVTFDVIQPQVTRDVVVLEGPPGTPGADGADGVDGIDGRSVVSIDRTGGTGAAGTVDTYTITYSSGSSSTFQVRNGSNGRGITSIARTSGTGAAGTTDTYTITYSNSTTSTFTVTNGANGTNGRGFTPRGVWVSGTTYAVDDIVTNAGSTYRRITAGAGTTAPGSDATNWELWAAKGADGSGGGGGAKLARVVRNSTTNSSYTISNTATPTDIDATNLALTVTLPASGKVDIAVDIVLATSAAGSPYICLREGTTPVVGSERFVQGDTTIRHHYFTFEVSGTAGTTHTYKLAWRYSGTPTFYAYYGGTEFGTTGYTGPIIMEARAVS